MLKLATILKKTRSFLGGFILSTLFSVSFCLAAFYDGQGNPSSVNLMTEKIPKGAIVVLGEIHGQPAVQTQQLQILNALRQQGHKVHVAMEFFTWNYQEALDQYRSGDLSESAFLQNIAWGKGFPFDYYRDQTLWPRAEQGERCLAINAPSALTRKVAKSGLSSLTDEEQKLLPPGFEIGNDLYFERFVGAIGHGTPAQMQNYFAAQSIWDDTMAYRTLLAQDTSDSSLPITTVIIVGEFHVQYGGGLPDRLKKRTSKPVITLSQVDASEGGYLPDEKYGQRADYVWLVDLKQP